MYNLAITVLAAVVLIQGCYFANESDSVTPRVEEPVLVAEVTDVRAVDLFVPAGSSGVVAVSGAIAQLSGEDMSIGGFPVGIRAVTGSLTTPDGTPAITDVQVLTSNEHSRFGPQDLPEGTDRECELLLQDANLLRAHDAFAFDLTFDVAEGAEGTFEVTLGRGDELMTDVVIAPHDGPLRSVSADLIGNNHPIVVRITITRG